MVSVPSHQWGTTRSLKPGGKYPVHSLRKKCILSLMFLRSGLRRLRICASTLTVCSLLSPVFLVWNFFRRSLVVMGLRVRYRRTASSVSCTSLQKGNRLMDQSRHYSSNFEKTFTENHFRLSLTLGSEHFVWRAMYGNLCIVPSEPNLSCRYQEGTRLEKLILNLIKHFMWLYAKFCTKKPNNYHLNIIGVSYTVPAYQ